MSNEKKQTWEELREHVRENVQTLHGFIMVLAIGNAIRQLATRHADILKENSGDLIISIDSNIFISFIIGLILIFRFFLGDRLLIKCYDPKNGFLFFIDMSNIFISSVLVAYISFFVTTPTYFYFMVCLLILSEIIWLILRLVFRITSSLFKKTEANISRRDRVTIGLSQSVAILTIVAIWVRAIMTGIDPFATPLLIFSEENLGWLHLIFAGNTILDLIINGPRYFGSTHRWIITRDE